MCCACGGGCQRGETCIEFQPADEWAEESDVCENDDTVYDSYGDTCSSYYDYYPGECGIWDTDTFNSIEACCVCTGGNVNDDGLCENDDSTTDSYGDTCSSYYDNYPAECGAWDTANFNSYE